MTDLLVEAAIRTSESFAARYGVLSPIGDEDDAQSVRLATVGATTVAFGIAAVVFYLCRRRRGSVSFL